MKNLRLFSKPKRRTYPPVFVLVLTHATPDFLPTPVSIYANKSCFLPVLSMTW